MKKIFYLFSIISFISSCRSAENDAAYQNYLKRNAQVPDLVFEHLPIKDIANIVTQYCNTISYDQWKKNNRELIGAAIGCRTEKVKELVEAQEVDVNARGIYGNNALTWVSIQGDKEIVQLLIEANANINDKNNDGNTVLMNASANKCKDIVELLINAGANVNDKNDHGTTALMFAAKRSQKEIIQVLINAKADVNAKDIKGRTALHYFVQNMHQYCPNNEVAKEIVKLLIKAGIDVHTKDYSGWTALMWATNKSHNEIAELLKNEGAE